MVKDPKEFFAKFAKLCDEYKVEIEVRENTRYYTTYVEGIDFDFGAIYDEDGMVRIWSEYQLGAYLCSDSIKEAAENAKVI